ncbi:hypothetical protein ACIQAL_09190 [Pseudomonas sp. NPDC088368]|uniref:hypothetical protein n=1 Tax=Pseudomonas sp. NPDC088368 TaxID=3364453 RepID=UPI0037F7CFB3
MISSEPCCVCVHDHPLFGLMRQTQRDLTRMMTIDHHGMETLKDQTQVQRLLFKLEFSSMHASHVEQVIDNPSLSGNRLADSIQPLQPGLSLWPAAGAAAARRSTG